MKWLELQASGELDGYESHFNAIDAECARDGKCGECSGEMRYIGRRKNSIYPHSDPIVPSYSYRAFAVCTECDEVIEF